MVIPDALKVLRLQHGHKNCRLGDVAASVRARGGRPAGASRRGEVDGREAGGCPAEARAPGRGKTNLHADSRERGGIRGSALRAVLGPVADRLPSPSPSPSPAPLQIGWKHKEAVAELEAKRKVKSAAYYEAKKKLVALRAKAEASVAKQ